jgi:hypothetical protein
VLPGASPTRFGNLVPKPRLKRKGRKISMSNPSNRSTGFMNFATQSDAPGGGRAKRVASSAGAPDLGHPSGEELRRVTGFLGVTHYVQAALSILVALFAAWLAYSAWHMYNLPNHGYAADDNSYGAGLGAVIEHWDATAFPGISCSLFLFGGFSFLVGNRLIRHQSRRFCRVFAIFECVLGVALVVVGLLILLLVRLGVIDGFAGGAIAIACFLSSPLTVIPCVIGIYTLRMLERQGASFV